MSSFSFSNKSRSSKTYGYPFFLEPTPNIQTRHLEENLSKNVMQIALKRYEEGLNCRQSNKRSEED